MLWKNGRRSTNVVDKRRIRVPRGKKGGGIAILLLALAGMYFGIDPTLIMNIAGDMQQETTATTEPPRSAEQQQLTEFISVVLADTEDTWNTIFSEKGGRYREPKLVLFTGEVQSACGFAQAAMGPFYCPADQHVYIDLAFYQDLKDQLDAPGDFAQAYVIAHEVGHHVQKLVGISDKVNEAKMQIPKKESNRLSVKLELQADCYAGIWANHADKVRNIVEKGDIKEALNAASHIGDDRLQQQSKGYITPDSFTHGSSRQRVHWFTVGYTKGTMEACDTFSISKL